jgi:hypothetical protein
VSPFSSYIRLEPVPRDRTMTEGVQARLGDPLWLLARQLAFGEFAGADAASPVTARLDYRTAPLTRLRAGDGSDPVPLPDVLVPLEPLVEAEPEPSEPPRAVAAAQAGMHYLRALAAAPGVGELSTYREGLLNAYPLSAAVSAGEPDDSPQVRLARVYAGRAPDGQALYHDLDRSLRRTDPPGLPTTVPIDGADPEVITRVAMSWLQWYDATSSRPFGHDLASVRTWQPSRLEYAFSLAAPGPDVETVLGSSEYTAGSLDWYQFDLLGSARRPASPTASLGAGPGDAGGPPQPAPIVTLATPILYPGMPNSRWWAFEDAAVSFGEISAPVESVATSLIVEFALRYGNDHFVVPIQLPLGTICRVDRFVVIDTFGERLLIRHVADVEPAGPFRLFEHSLPTEADGAAPVRDPLFVLFPTLDRAMSGGSIEDVVYLRDEFADVVWGIESRVLGTTGLPVDRTSAAVAALAEARNRARQVAIPAAEERPPTFTYRLRTEVQDNWFAFSLPDPVAETDPRTGRETLMPFTPIEPEGGGTPPPPLGVILSEQQGAGGVFQEEVTRAGVEVARMWRYARWCDGRQMSWVARSVRPGRGEVDSGLRFDLAE